MGIKVTPTNITTLDNSSTATSINENSDLLADEFDKVVYRDGSFDMSGDLNMGSNRIINLGVPQNPSDAARYADVIVAATGLGEEVLDPLFDRLDEVETIVAGVSQVFKPETYGAVGDGVTNDHDAFEALSASLTANGGGTIELAKGATYIVGKQIAGGGGRYFFGQPVINLVNAGRVIINLNGATLKIVSGFRFGAFNTLTGLPHSGTPVLADTASTGYMVLIEDCDSFHIYGGTIDMNSSGHIIGSEYGAGGGIQLECYGIYVSNTPVVNIEASVNILNSCLDGVLYSWSCVDENEEMVSATVSALVDGVARNGLSVTGCNGLELRHLRVFRAGDAPVTGYVGGATLKAPPAASCDVEPEGGNICVNIKTYQCHFIAGANANTSWTWGGGNVRYVEHYGTVFDGIIYAGAFREVFKHCKFRGVFALLRGNEAVLADNTQLVDCVIEDVSTYQDLSGYPALIQSAASGPGVRIKGCSITVNSKTIVVGGYDISDTDIYVKYSTGNGGAFLFTDNDTRLLDVRIFDQVTHVPSGPFFVSQGSDTIIDGFIFSSNNRVTWVNVTVGRYYSGVSRKFEQQATVSSVAGGATVDVEARTALNDVIAKLKTAGILAT